MAYITDTEQITEATDPVCPVCQMIMDFQLRESIGQGLRYRCSRCKIIVEVKKL